MSGTDPLGERPLVPPVSPVSAIPEQLPKRLEQIIEAGSGKKHLEIKSIPTPSEGYDLSRIPSAQKQSVARQLLKEPLLNPSDTLTERENTLKRETLLPVREALERLANGQANEADVSPLRLTHDAVSSLVVVTYAQGTNKTPVPTTSSELLAEITSFHALAASLAPAKQTMRG